MLRTLIQQVEQFEQRRAQLQQRVTLIEQLRRGQSGPVHLLDQISRSLPDMLWLTELKQQGDTLTIAGRCMALTALSDFVTNLEASGYFKKPVDILDSQVEPAQAGQAELIRVSVQGAVRAAGIVGTAGKGSAMALNLNKLPWYAQVTVFVAAVGGRRGRVLLPVRHAGARATWRCGSGSSTDCAPRSPRGRPWPGGCPSSAARSPTSRRASSG